MERVSTALTAIKDAGETGANSIGGVISSSTESGVSAFKGTSLGESFFKNIGAIMVVVFILLGCVIYVELAKTANKASEEKANEEVKANSKASTAFELDQGEGSKKTSSQTIKRTVYVEPNTGLLDRVISTDVHWTAPLISKTNELKEAFGTPYTEKELEKMHTKCSDSFCVMHQKSPAELERACNSISTKQMCGTKCCCGWTKYTGFEGDNDPAVLMNTAEANAKAPNGISDNSKTPGKCVAGNSKRPYDIKDEQNRENDIAYYYYLGECVGGRGCMKKGAVKA
jgi:hypothetical protein